MLEARAHHQHLGDAKSLITHPATTTHQRLTPAVRAELGISDGLVRLSVGLEHPDDIAADLTVALERCDQSSSWPRSFAPQRKTWGRAVAAQARHPRGRLGASEGWADKVLKIPSKLLEGGFCGNETNFGIPNEINVVRFPASSLSSPAGG